MIQYYSISLERSFLRAIISVSNMLRELYEDTTFGHGIFADKTNQRIYQSLIKYYQLRGVVPTEEIFQKFIIKYLKRSNIMTKSQQVERYQILISKLYERETTDKERANLPQIREELIGMKKGRVMQENIIKASDALDNGEIKCAENLFMSYKIDLLSEADVSDEGDYVQDWAERVKLLKMKRKYPELFKAIPSGIRGWNPDDPFKNTNPTQFDVFIDGGHYDGELTLIIGDSGTGKSFELMEYAYNAALAGKNVGYFSIEMNKWKIETRLDSRISGIPFRKFRMATINKKEFIRWKDRVEAFNANKRIGHIAITGFFRGCTVATIEQKARDMEQKMGKSIDIMIVDYLNDIRPSTNIADKDWIAQGQISWDLKLLASSWKRGKGIPIVTATQGKSSSSLSKFKTMEDGKIYFKRMRWNDAAFSPLPSQHASVIIGLLQSKGDENNIGTMINHQVIKNRDGETNIGIVTFPKLNVCRMNSQVQYRSARNNYEILNNTSQAIEDL